MRSEFQQITPAKTAELSPLRASSTTIKSIFPDLAQPRQITYLLWQGVGKGEFSAELEFVVDKVYLGQVVRSTYTSLKAVPLLDVWRFRCN